MLVGWLVGWLSAAGGKPRINQHQNVPAERILDLGLERELLCAMLVVECQNEIWRIGQLSDLLVQEYQSR